MAKVEKIALLKDGEFEVKEVVNLNFFDLSGAKAKTKGSSNKTYTAELHYAKKGSKCQIYSLWGPTGGNQTKDWRHFDSQEKAKKEFDKIVKSKKKKGYVEIDVAQRAIGSEEAKKIVKPVQLIGVPDKQAIVTSSLHPKVQYLVGELFGQTNQWVSSVLKCPLGQLTNAQIDKGRDILSQALIINDKKRKTSKDKEKIEELTNDFYSLIPHNLGTGSRGQLTHLLLDDAGKIAQKESDLDTLLDAKSVGAVLAADSKVDDRYKSLNAEFNYLEPDSTTFKWINKLVQKTKARNHHWLGTINVLNVWKIARNKEEDRFLDTAKEIGKVCKGQVIPDMYKGLGVDDRNDIDNQEIFKKANILPLFHGTRTENLIGITKQGLLIRPHNAVLTGAMYGNGVYTSSNSTKSINYTSIRSSYWSKGNADKAYLFLTDTILGDQKIASGSYQYNKNNIKPYHSVWAKGGKSGVINDEMMVYDTSQIKLAYLIEFTCK